jgi:1-phosphofructokinase family hexose kinase
LGGEPFCLGFVGGHTGRLLADLAQSEGLNSSWTWINADTRTCTILISQNGDATVINEPGASVSKSDWEQLEGNARKNISSASLACVSGSLPPDSSVGDIQRLLSVLADSGKQVWVDTSGAALKAVLAVPGICIKVNRSEVSELIGWEVKDMKSGQRALMTFVERGVTASVITFGAGGALLATKDGRWYAQPPGVRIVSTVGSGDAFMGGLLSALDHLKNLPEALLDAVAAGTANVLSAGGGHFEIQEFESIRERIQIETW